MLHNKTTFLLSLSRLFERSGYYGLRSVLVLYLIGETLNLDTTEALKIYAIFTFSLLFTQVLGAIIGDLVLGNKKAILIGGILQILGTLTFINPTINSVYIGTTLISLGCGFYTPNILSQFGKSYLDRPKLLDSGFTIFYLAINFGAFLGMITTSLFEENYTNAFIISSGFFLISTIMMYFSKEISNLIDYKNKKELGIRVITIITVMVLIGIFWGVYDFIGTHKYLFQSDYYSTLNSEFLFKFREAYDSIFSIGISVFFIFLWSFIFIKQHWKLIFGFIIAALSIGILLLIPEVPAEEFKFVFIVSALLLTIAELLIAPTILSVLTKYASPKYLAIIMSLMFISTGLFIKLFSIIITTFPNLTHTNVFNISTVILTFTSIAVLVFVFVLKNLFIKKGAN